MRCLATLVWIFSLSTRISLLTHATPLELHFIPYRWHYPTALVVAPAAVDRTALVVTAADAPSGREAEVKEKDKYGEDYTLEEIVFSNGDIGETGKLDYYIDEGIEYYDVDIFAAAYSGDKTKPKQRPKFGADVDTFNNPRLQDGQAMPVQEGRHFNSYSGNSYYQPYQQNIARPIPDLEDKGLVRYSDQNNLDSRRFHSFNSNPDYHQNTQHTTMSPFTDSRVGSFHDGRRFNSYSGIPEYQTSPQSTVSPISDLRINGFVDYSAKNNQDGRSFNSYSGNPDHDTSQHSLINPVSGSNFESSVGYSGQRVQGTTAGFNSHRGSSGYQTSEEVVLYSGQNTQDGNSVNSYSGNPRYQTLHPHLKEYIVTSPAFSNRGRFIYRLNGQGQDIQAHMKQRLENKDEIMEAVE